MRALGAGERDVDVMPFVPAALEPTMSSRATPSRVPAKRVDEGESKDL